MNAAPWNPTDATLSKLSKISQSCTRYGYNHRQLDITSSSKTGNVKTRQRKQCAFTQILAAITIGWKIRLFPIPMGKKARTLLSSIRETTALHCLANKIQRKIAISWNLSQPPPIVHPKSMGVRWCHQRIECQPISILQPMFKRIQNSKCWE